MLSKVKTVLFVLSLLFSLTLCNAQENTKSPVKEGIITLYVDNMVGFSNLQFVGDNVVYTDITNNVREVKPLKAVQRIQDDNQKTVYEGGKYNPEYNGPDSRPVTERPKPVIVKDTLFKPDYPIGIYYTKEDFIAKKAEKIPVTPRELVGFEKAVIEGIPQTCFFYINDRKIKDAFAVSYRGCLYFSLKAILKNRNKTDRAQTSDFINSFVRVIIGGDNYFYTEADLTNKWAQALAYNTGGGFALAKSIIYGKGIVWDFKNTEFNIFKNCKDYNDFIQPLYPQGVQQCKDNQPNGYKVREAIEKVK